MTDYFAVFLGHQRDDAAAVFSQFFYKFSLCRLAEGRRSYLENSFPVAWAFVADANHALDFSTERQGRQV